MDLQYAVNPFAMIAKYSDMLDDLTGKHAELESRLLNSDQAGSSDTKTADRKDLARIDFQLALVKQFLEFWKNTIKSGIEILKSLDELATSGR